MSRSPQASELDLATAVHPRGDGTTFDAVVDAGFTVGGKPNGGYLLALVARAAGEALGAAGSEHRDPLAATAHFVGAPDAGPATVAVEVLRTGRSASQARATLRQDGRTCVEATVTVGTLPGPEAGPWWSGRPPVKVAPREACPRLPARREGAPFEVAIMDRSDLRLDPACLGFAAGRPAGRGELNGWISFPDESPITPLALLFFLDALPPATFDLAATGWVPTLSLTAYVRARPAPGPLVVSQRAQSVDDGRVDEVCELWDASGRLVGQATQLAAIRIPEGVEPPTVG
ncbi:MAG: thioesterase family protein [Actinobacteria bacterium]|nr:thioesterase family protein [Actinomycetota bacterium]